MSAETETLERQLRQDLEALGDLLADEKCCTELYRALANRAWRRDGGPDGHVTLSWGRAEALVNELRATADRPSLTLAQTGGEGELSETVAAELGAHGWHSVPENTGRHDDQHVDAGPAAPEGGGETPEWEREAHQQAEESRAQRGPRG